MGKRGRRTSFSFAADTSRAFDMHIVRAGGKDAMAAGVMLQMIWEEDDEENIAALQKRGSVEMKREDTARTDANRLTRGGNRMHSKWFVIERGEK